MPTNTTAKSMDAPLPPVPAPRGGLFKRLTTKLHRQPVHLQTPPTTLPKPSAPTPLAAANTNASTSAAANNKPTRRTTLRLPSLPKPHAVPLDDFTSAAHRAAAMRARGLVPARRDTIPLSEQEAERDKRFSVLVEVPGDESGEEGESEAKRIREAWLKRNVVNEVGEDEGDDVDPAGIPLPASPRSLRSRGGEADTDVKVSEWLRSTPTKVRAGKEPARDDDADSDVLPSPATASLSTARRKEKPKPITTSTRGSEEDTAPPRLEFSALPPLPPSPPLESQDSHTRRTLAVPTLAVPAERGRAIPIAPSSSGSSMPALSPTRTYSSSTTTESPHTPTTSHMRRSSAASRESGSQNSHSDNATPRASKVSAQDRTAVIVENPSEDEEAPLVPDKSLEPEHVERRRAGLFGKRADLGPPLSKSAHAAASMSNLRRSVTGTFSSRLSLRPKSALVLDTTMEASELSNAAGPSSLESEGSGRPRVVHSASMPMARPRPRQALSPTMHNRGSILLQAKGIEDEESRRLSELAFLDF